jgi:hypothetical protein
MVVGYTATHSSSGNSSASDISKSPRLFLPTPLRRKVHRLRPQNQVAKRASDDQKEVTHRTFCRTPDAPGTSFGGDSRTAVNVHQHK